MTWSLKIRNGDLALDGTNLAQTTGPYKLVQDLRCAILEKMGTDDLHPDFGSLLDGGRMPDGTEAQSVIGSTSWEEVALIVESEIMRITNQLQRRQVARGEADRHVYGRSMQTPNELLQQVSSIDMLQQQDHLVVRVALETGSGQTQVLDLPVASEPILTR